MSIEKIKVNFLTVNPLRDRIVWIVLFNESDIFQQRFKGIKIVHFRTLLSGLLQWNEQGSPKIAFSQRTWISMFHIIQMKYSHAYCLYEILMLSYYMYMYVCALCTTCSRYSNNFAEESHEQTPVVCTCKENASWTSIYRATNSDQDCAE